MSSVASRGSLAVLSLASALACACHSSRAQSPGVSDADWYDASPLVVSLRPEARAGAVAAAGVSRLEDLPLYDLDLSIDPVAGTFTLAEDIWFTNLDKTPLDDVVLRIYADALGGAKPGKPPAPPPVRFLSGGCTLGATCVVASDGASAIGVHPSSPLPAGARLKISLKLGGVLGRIDASRTNLLAQGMEGLSTFSGGGEGAGDYGLLATGDGITSLANFYAVVARRNERGWERSDRTTIGDLGPDDLSNVRASVELPESAKLATVGVVQKEDTLPGGKRRRVSVAAAMIRDFSLLSSDDFVVATEKVGDVDVRAYYLPGDKAAGDTVVDIARAALTDFERRFGPYPYAGFDVVEAAIVGGAGGVEFSGLVTAASMLYRPMDAGGGPLAAMLKMAAPGGFGAMTGSMLEFVVAHEVAHQWWHGLVGSDSRVHPFLDEGLAQYSAILYEEDRYGNERARRDGDMNAKMNYQMMRMMGTPDGAVDRPVEAFGSTFAYGGLVYGKGPYFYAALREETGDAAFFGLLRAYVTKYRFKIAPPHGLIDLAAAGANGPRIRALAAHWLDEEHGDEDLGKVDLAGMMGSMLGGQLGDISKLLQPLGQALGDAGAGDGGARRGKKGAAPHGAADGGAAPMPDPNDMLRQLMQGMGQP